MQRDRRTGCLIVLVLIAGVVCVCTGVAAQSPLIGTDVTYQSLELVSPDTVSTWEEDGVRVFVAANGAEIRQGRVRLAAPRMVVWFDKNESLKPDVRAATIRVYAQGTGKAGEAPEEPVRLVEGTQVRQKAVVCMRFRSKLSFAWDCPLRVVEDTEQGVPFYAIAESETRDIAVDFERDTLPEAVPAEWPTRLMTMLNAEEFSMFPDEEGKTVTAVYLGDVRGSYRNVDIAADVAVLWIDLETQTFEAYARGNVFVSKKLGETEKWPRPETGELVQRLESLRADELYIYPDRERAFATRAELRQKSEVGGTEDIQVVRGREVYLLDSQTMYIREGSFSTCPYAHPHYQIGGGEVDVTRQEPTTFITARPAKVLVGRGETLLFGPPFLTVAVGRDGFALRSVSAGSSRKFGPFLMSSWRLTHLGMDYDWVDRWTFDVGYYGDRGPAFGTELSYHFADADGRDHHGDLRVDYVSDSGEEDDTGLPVPQQQRGRVRLRHRSPLSAYWRADLVADWHSDSGFLREYFEEEFMHQQPPETYLLARYRRDNTWLGLVVKPRINEFLNQTQELPSVELQRIAVPVGPGIYDATYEVGIYDLEPSDELALSDPPGLLRLHTEQRMSWPFYIGSVRMDPFLRAMATWASKGDNRDGTYSGGQSRLGAGGGVRASIDYAREYNVFSEPFEVNRLRHLMTPFAEVEALPIMTGNSEDFVQLGGLDPWPRGGLGARAGADRIDAIDKRHELRLGLRQLLQTKRGTPANWSSVDWMELDTAYVIRSDDSVAVPVDDDYFEADFDWRLTPDVTLYSRDNRLSTGDGVDVLNAGVEVALSETSEVSLDYIFLTDRMSRVTAGYHGKLSDRYGLMIEQEYELDSPGTGANENMETHVVLRRFLHKWLFDIGVRYERSTDEVALLVGFGPATGGLWGATALGMGSTE